MARRNTTNLEDRIRQLESDLWMARMAIIELMPEDFQRVLYPSDDDLQRGIYPWFRETVRKVIEMADVVRMEDPIGVTRRAVCPLCRAEARNYYNIGPGFTYPEGLRRHLEGSHRSVQCTVIRAARDIAHANLARKEELARYPLNVAQQN
jgi:hypothetical protein